MMTAVSLSKVNKNELWWRRFAPPPPPPLAQCTACLCLPSASSIDYSDRTKYLREGNLLPVHPNAPSACSLCYSRDPAALHPDKLLSESRTNDPEVSAAVIKYTR